MTELDSAKTTVDVIPPEPAKLSTTLINAASHQSQVQAKQNFGFIEKIKLFCPKQLLMIQVNLFFLSRKVSAP